MFKLFTKEEPNIILFASKESTMVAIVVETVSSCLKSEDAGYRPN
jgi:hypothetical protein